MRMRIAVIALLAAGGLWWAQSASGQAQPVPGFGSGIVTVQGTVGIGKLPDKLPDIDVGQRGEWRVAVSDTPTVTPALPPVLALRRCPHPRDVAQRRERTYRRGADGRRLGTRRWL